jgi:molecular chaperone GrpE
MAKKDSGKNKMKNETGNEENIINHPSEYQNNTKDTDTKITEEGQESEPQTQEISNELVDIALEKLAEMQDKYLRLSAEFDNYRKRTLKEKADLIKTAGESVVLKIIPVLDDFERAIGFINGEGNVDESKQGIFLIYKKMKEILTQQGLKEIDSFHKEFDTDIHEALTKIPAPDKKLKGKVIEVIEKGYFLGDKVVRYAKVVVGE